MADLGTISIQSHFGSELSNVSVQGTEPVLQVLASASDSDYLYDDSNSTHQGYAGLNLSDMPSDFDSMDTIYVNLRYFLDATKDLNSWINIKARIISNFSAQWLTDTLTVVGTTITNTTPTNSGAVQFTLTTEGQNASKTDWDSAILYIYWDIIKSKGGDAVNEIISAGELTGTYTSTVTAIPNKIFQLNQAVKRSRYW